MSTHSIWYNDGGNVGIGTDSPSKKLDVSGNIRASGDVTANRLCIGTSCISSWSDVRDTDWIESGGNVYRSSGNVGIGTSSPSQTLDVAGKIRMRTQTASGDANDIVATKGYMDSKLGNSGNHIQIFTSSGTFTVPAGVTRVKITLVGGGGGGAITGYVHVNQGQEFLLQLVKEDEVELRVVIGAQQEVQQSLEHIYMRLVEEAAGIMLIIEKMFLLVEVLQVVVSIQGRFLRDMLVKMESLDFHIPEPAVGLGTCGEKVLIRLKVLIGMQQMVRMVAIMMVDAVVDLLIVIIIVFRRVFMVAMALLA